MIREFAFVGIPVTDMKRARDFYEGVLGLHATTKEADANWVEYEVGNATLGLASYGERWKPGASGSGTMASFETDDVDAMMRKVKSSGATIALEAMDSPVCRFGMVLDPDGNTIMLHKRKAA